MKKVSQVLREAVEDCRYLNNDRRKRTSSYLCEVLNWRVIEGGATQEEAKAASQAMQLDGGGTILNRMEIEMKLPSAEDEFMHNACFRTGDNRGPKGLPNDLRLQYWAFLIWDLTRKGQ